MHFKCHTTLHLGVLGRERENVSVPLSFAALTRQGPPHSPPLSLHSLVLVGVPLSGQYFFQLSLYCPKEWILSHSTFNFPNKNYVRNLSSNSCVFRRILTLLYFAKLCFAVLCLVSNKIEIIVTLVHEINWSDFSINLIHLQIVAWRSKAKHGVARLFPCFPLLCFTLLCFALLCT